MSAFAFHPELFDYRNDALEVLGDAGLQWMTDFASVDVLHDLYGLEVCGVPEEVEARRMLVLLQRRFSGWGFGHVSLKDYGTRDLGWKVVVHRDPRDGHQREHAG